MWECNQRSRAAVGLALAGLLACWLSSPSLALSVSDPVHYQAVTIVDTIASPFGLLVGGGNGFPVGLYVSEGLFGGDKIHVYTPDGQLEVFASGLGGTEGMAFGPGGAWGNDLYIAETDTGTISRVLADGTHSVIASGFDLPYGPTGIVFGAGGDFGDSLYAVNYSSNTVWQLDAPGIMPSMLATIGLDNTGAPGIGVAGGKGMAFVPIGWSPTYGGKLFLGTYDSTLDEGTTEPGVQVIDATGAVSTFLGPMVGLEFLAFAPGAGSGFGSDLYMTSMGAWSALDDGAIFVVDPQGGMHTFATGIDAVGIAFDHEGIFGGDLFVTDFNDGKVYQIGYVPEPATMIALAGSLGGLGMYIRRRRKGATAE